jgi:two-component system, LuxR family, sensor kinase FixL
MKDYSRMTKAELIEHLKCLEPLLAGQRTEPSPAEAVVEDKLTEAALRDSAERIRAIVNTAVEGIITIDERGMIQSINPAAEKMFGYSAEEMSGRNISILMPSPYEEEHDAYLANYLLTGKAKVIGIGREVVGQRKDKTLFPMYLSVGEMHLASGRCFTGIVRDISERKRLEKEILEISNREQQRIGQDLHDGLCQYLAGIELKCQLLEEELESKSPREAARASEIAGHVREAITQTRSLARGLSPVELDSDGLITALQELAVNIEKLFKIECRVQCAEPILIQNTTVANHVYRIAQEASNNAIKHGKARQIVIEVRSENDRAILTVADDGVGFPKETQKHPGMGLRIMKYRAGMIDALLDVRPGDTKGTTVVCIFKKDV